VGYLLTVGRWLTPVREAPDGLLESYDLREYLTALRVADDSPLAGRSLAETRFGDARGLQVVEIRRSTGERIVPPSGGTVVHGGDVLVVTGSVPDIARVEHEEHLAIVGSLPELEPRLDPRDEAGAPHLAELLV